MRRTTLSEQWSRVEAVTAIARDRVLVIAPTSFRFKASGLGLDDQRFDGGDAA